MTIYFTKEEFEKLVNSLPLNEEQKIVTKFHYNNYQTVKLSFKKTKEKFERLVDFHYNDNQSVKISFKDLEDFEKIAELLPLDEKTKETAKYHYNNDQTIEISFKKEEDAKCDFYGQIYTYM